ncbi:hypothetical protein [Curtobacterium sp. MCBD17_003]|uniref:hypothetical protein n=1 Tax=Curtobacterium sp. MCBD17_003 TaxID=2175667 RepID=UPI000DA9F411|nr:hypothetical protein [Curtobacterium sp. MCBD17_003]WIE54230.1 hypothetical protein DEI88_014065 [Curtobacterium sp. MCBD17_003]
MVGATTYREPEFDEHQVALLLNHQRQARDMGSHGQPMSEALSPEADPSRDGGWHYEASEYPTVDYAELALSQARDSYFEKHGKKLSDAQKRSMHWRVHRVEG